MSALLKDIKEAKHEFEGAEKWAEENKILITINPTLPDIYEEIKSTPLRRGHTIHSSSQSSSKNKR